MRVSHCRLVRLEGGWYTARCTRCASQLYSLVGVFEAIDWAKAHASVCPRRHQPPAAVVSE